MKSARLNGIDLGRMLGAFFVILLHADYGNMPVVYVENLRLISRWALPFFFMASGYFLAGKIGEDGTIPLKSVTRSILRLMVIQIITSSIYILSEFALNGYLNIKLKFFFTGACFHLWFISSLILGYLGIWLLIRIKKVWIIRLVSFSLLLMAIFADGYDLYFHQEIPFSPFRFLLSIPLMYIGLIISNVSITKRVSFLCIIVAALGLYLQYSEANLLYTWFGIHPSDRQFLFGTLLMSVSVFCFAANVQIGNNLFSQIGAKYSLFVYLYHPLIFLLIRKLNQSIISGSGETIERFSPVLAFLICVGTAIALNQKAPLVYPLMNGHTNDWRRLIRLRRSEKGSMF